MECDKVELIKEQTQTISIYEVKYVNYRDIITLEPGKRSGKPCIRGLRITVYDVLEMLAQGMTSKEIIDDFPELNEVDIQACLSYAADREQNQLMLSR